MLNLTAKYSKLNYHFVFIPKRRKKVLTGVIAERLQQIICDVCNENTAGNICTETVKHYIAQQRK
ncbi:transposase [Sphaerospermopsis aphanizomenoides BCCUSP55]|nr:transposase [Sphaerospermopsis aphanizomenoides BCCUSP55]